MSKIVWDKVGERLYETGVDHAVLYPIDTNGAYSRGVAWNGITSIAENPTGAEPSPVYADNIKYANLLSNEEYGATIEALMSPPEFEECDGSLEVVPGMYIGQQARKTFGLAYRTVIGSDTELNEKGYKIHLVYGCLAAPSSRTHSTISDSVEPETLSWEVSTTPVPITEEVEGKKMKPTATMVFDSTKFSEEFMTQLEEKLYGKDPTQPEGDDGVEPMLPMPDEIIKMFKAGVGGS